MSTKILASIFALQIVLAASGCSGDRMGEFKFPGSGGVKEREEAPRPIVTMGGRWLLTSPNRGQCNMNFTGAPKATGGTIAPEGGCPGNFFTSRKWTLSEDGKIIIEDHNGQQLVQMTPSSTGTTLWFEGQAATGERVMLAR